MKQWKKTGVYEWADKSVNIQIGCEHNCRYCYARYRAVHRFKYCASEAAWADPVINAAKVAKGYTKNYGTVMFPSTHDITQWNIDACCDVLKRLAKAGNRLLIVSKPHYDCVRRLCEELAAYRDQVLFRFTIGSADSDVLAFWEPGAPPFAERLDCLSYARAAGFATSVSCEPFLDRYPDRVYALCAPYVTESFWVGTVRGRHRVRLDGAAVDDCTRYVMPLQNIQNDAFVKKLAETLDGKLFVKWKDSIREIINGDED